MTNEDGDLLGWARWKGFFVFVVVVVVVILVIRIVVVIILATKGKNLCPLGEALNEYLRIVVYLWLRSRSSR